eukprot:6461993-Amphidinium_carterae.2
MEAYNQTNTLGRIENTVLPSPTATFQHTEITLPLTGFESSMFLLSQGLDALKTSASIKVEEWIEAVTGTTFVRITGCFIHIEICLSVSVSQALRQLGLSPRVLDLTTRPRRELRDYTWSTILSMLVFERILLT